MKLISSLTFGVTVIYCLVALRANLTRFFFTSAGGSDIHPWVIALGLGLIALSDQL